MKFKIQKFELNLNEQYVKNLNFGYKTNDFI